MRDIRERLDEIQKSTSSGSNAPSNGNSGEMKKEASGQNEDQTVKRSVHKAVKSTQEDLNWQANKSREINPGKRKRKASASLIYTIISLIISLGIIGYLAYTLLIADANEEFSAGPEQVAAEKGAEGTDAGEDAGTVSVSEVEEESKPVDAAEAESPVSEISPAVENVPEPRPSSSAKVPSGYIISYSTNGTRDAAEKNVQKLKGMGYTAHYYYMPDKSAGSQALYKVYIGPYKDEADAFPDFRKIAAINKQCYILRVD